MMVAAPRVSTAGSLRTMAPRLAMRCMPSARVMVVMAGKPLGDRGDREAHGLQEKLVPGSARPASMPQPRRIAESARQAMRICCPKRSRRFSRGVFWSPTSRIIDQCGRARCGAGGRDDGAPFPAGDRRPREDHGRAVGERCVLGDGGEGILYRRGALPGEGRFLGGEADGLDEPRVGGHRITRLELEDVAGRPHRRQERRGPSKSRRMRALGAESFWRASRAASARRSW